METLGQSSIFWNFWKNPLELSSAISVNRHSVERGNPTWCFSCNSLYTQVLQNLQLILSKTYINLKSLIKTRNIRKNSKMDVYHGQKPIKLWYITHQRKMMGTQPNMRSLRGMGNTTRSNAKIRGADGEWIRLGFSYQEHHQVNQICLLR